MINAGQHKSPCRPSVLRAHELVQIAKGAANLPGGWSLDPVTDIRKVSAPRVWLHPAGENMLAISLGFSKQGGVFHVLVRHYDEANDTPRDEIQYFDLPTAFAKLAALLEIMLDAQRCEPEFGSCSMPGGVSQNVVGKQMHFVVPHL